MNKLLNETPLSKLHMTYSCNTHAPNIFTDVYGPIHITRLEQSTLLHITEFLKFKTTITGFLYIAPQH
jgi:hypothetical protein